MRITFVSPDNWCMRIAEELGRRGHVLSASAPDALVCMSVSVMDKAEELLRTFPKPVKFFPYHWDCYSWVWSRPREGEYDWPRWGRLLEKATEVWCPSRIEMRRLFTFFCFPKAHVVPTFVPELEKFSTDHAQSSGCVLDILRVLPDYCAGWCEGACKELGLNYVCPNHKLTELEYVSAVKGCAVVVSAYREASTGGLGLVEAAWCGKPAIVNGMGGNAGTEYLPEAHQFVSYDQLKQLLSAAVDGKLEVRSLRERAKDFALETMVDRIEERLHAYVP